MESPCAYCVRWIPIDRLNYGIPAYLELCNSPQADMRKLTNYNKARGVQEHLYVGGALFINNDIKDILTLKAVLLKAFLMKLF